jgi:hypothetical protein
LNAATSLLVATTAVDAAELAGTQASVDAATTLVDALPAGVAKTDLSDRLDAVQVVIDDAVALAAAITAGNLALTAYTVAGGLEAGALWIALDDAITAAVTIDITAATTALNAATSLLVATAAVDAAVIAETQAAVTSARTLVNALPTGDAKAALVELGREVTCLLYRRRGGARRRAAGSRGNLVRHRAVPFVPRAIASSVEKRRQMPR